MLLYSLIFCNHFRYSRFISLLPMIFSVKNFSRKICVFFSSFLAVSLPFVSYNFITSTYQLYFHLNMLESNYLVRNFNGSERNRKFQKYEADYADYLMSKHFSNKDIYGGKQLFLFDPSLQMSIDLFFSLILRLTI